MRWLLMALLPACVPVEGWQESGPGEGPMVRVDWDAEPLPDIPWPNDLATRPDPTSPTGLRLNLPEEADIAIERLTRHRLNQATGFGLFSPITVGFEERLDLRNIVERHPDDLHIPGHFSDDVILVIDVDRDSPEFGQPVELDLGGGRFPRDRFTYGRTLANDPRAAAASLVFDTVDEDLNGDGVLSPGEDTDNDGILDESNVFPPGSDPLTNLMTFYELASDTLIARPVIPLREATRYAVVLTRGLVGEDGQPVRSPWPAVNHTRQTASLEPLEAALADLGLASEDVAFAWTFTTGEPTRELREVVEGLQGRGPFASLATEMPAGVREAHELHRKVEVGDPLSLTVDQIVAPLSQIGFFPAASVDALADEYRKYTRAVVGGAIRSPWLLPDTNGDGSDEDEVWHTDRRTGQVIYEDRRVAFTCAVPRESDGYKAPFPVAIHAHGYGSMRLEFVAFAHTLNRQGIAVCGLDAAGHGLDLDDGLTEIVNALLVVNEAEPFFWHLKDNRARDLDNDGAPDNAGDQFSADVVHTRDMVRQPVVDWAQLIRSIRQCGTGTMARTLPTVDGMEDLGEDLMACDFDLDGTPDFGGPDVPIYLHGVSLGGVEGSLATAVIDDIEAAVLTVPGGGLTDVAVRSNIAAVVEGMTGRAISPIIVGIPTEEGLQIDQVVVSVDQDAHIRVATLTEDVAGGVVEVENLATGHTTRAMIPDNEAFRVPFAANALTPAEKRLLTGMPEGGPQFDLDVYTAPGNKGLGDEIVVRIFDGSGRQVAEIDAFEETVRHEGVTMEAGSPLVAGSWGLGKVRATPELRRLVDVLSLAVEPGDPIVYANRWFTNPYGEEKNVLVALTLGDESVPESAGIALARAAGLVNYSTVSERLGTSEDRWLIEREVVHGLEEVGPYLDPEGQPILFDPDDADGGLDGFGAPSEELLRLTRDLSDGTAGVRFLMVDPRGAHAYLVPDPELPFDINLYGANQMAAFLGSGGRDLIDDHCLESNDCDFVRTLELP